jgi:putative membrane protein
MSNRENQGEGQAGGLKGALNKATDAVGGAVGKASASTAGSHSSAAFVANAGMGDLYEVEAGRIAAQRGSSDAVRSFGQMMVEHHTTAMHQMQSALMSSEVAREGGNLRMAAELDNRRQGMLKHLLEAPAGDFDKVYIDQQRASHKEAATLHRGYVEHGDNPQLRSVAMGGLPMIERHLRALERIGVH